MYIIKYLTTILVQFHIINSVFVKTNLHPKQLLLYFDNLYSSKKQADCIYLDFSKAFDSVPHNELLIKLWSVGITDKLWTWFQSY